MIIRCPRCNDIHIVVRYTTDFVCSCDSGDPVLDNDSIVVVGNWEDFTGSADVPDAMQAGKANTVQDDLESQRRHIHIGPKNIFGDNLQTHRIRQHEEYFKIK